MRITIVSARPGLSGGARVVADYAAHLLQRGHDVRVVARRVAKPTIRARLESLLRNRPLPSGRSPFMEKLGDRFTRLGHDGDVRADDVPDADVVVATFWNTAQSVADLPPSKGEKVYFMQDYGAPGQPIESVRETWKLGLKIITINSQLKGEVEELARDPVALVLNGADPDVISDEDRAFRTGDPKVGFVFSNNEMKGSRYCVEAVALARAEVPGLSAVAFGNKPPEMRLPPFVSFRHGISDQEIRGIYASADAWLFGSLREGFGLPILEALGNGTPVIAANSAAAPDVLSRGGGYLVAVKDAQAMARKLVAVCRMPAPEWEALSREARATAARFTIARARARFEAAVVAAGEGRWQEFCLAENDSN